MLAKTQELTKLLSSRNPENIQKICNEIEHLIKFDVASLQTSGGQAQDCFYVVFLALLDRVLGEDTTGCNPPITWIRGITGGWLRESMSIQRGTVRSTSTSLLNLFAAEGNMIKLICRLHRTVECRLNLFSRKVQLKLLHRPEYELVKTFNHEIYDNWYREVKVDKKVNAEGREVVLILNLFAYFIVCFLRYPSLENVFPASLLSFIDSSQQGPTLSNYFDISSMTNSTFDWREPPVLSTLRLEGEGGWINGNTYLVLLKQYLNCFLPDPLEKYGDDLLKREGLQAENSFTIQGETFLRLIIDFWIDTNLTVRQHYDKVQVMREQMFASRAGLPTVATKKSDVGLARMDSRPICPTMYHRSNSSSSDSGKIGSNADRKYSCLEVLSLESQSAVGSSYTQATLQCIYIVLSHVTSQINVAYLSSKTSPMTQAMQLSQPAVFDMLRTILSRGDSLDKTVFFLASDIWHLWIAPWQRIKSRDPATNSIKLAKQKFSNVWRPYICANLHFYTSLFVLYMKSMATRDMLNNINGLYCLEKTLKIFERDLVATIDLTMEAYSAKLEIQNIRRNQIVEDSPQKPGIGLLHRASSKRLVSDESIDELFAVVNSISKLELGFIVKQHKGLFPESSLTDADLLVNYKNETKKGAIYICDILRRIDVHQPTFLESVIFRLARYFIGNIMSEERTSRVSEIVKMLSTLLSIEGTRDRVHSTSSASEFNRHDRTEDDLGTLPIIATPERTLRQGRMLTESGRKQLFDGFAKCSKEGLTTSRDILERPLRSYEFSDLAKLMVHFSKQVNQKYGLPKDPTTVSSTWAELLNEYRYDYSRSIEIIAAAFRFNFRIFAHVRVFSCICILLLLAMFQLRLLNIIPFIVSTAGLGYLWYMGKAFDF